MAQRKRIQPVSIRLWCRLAAAAPIQPLVWELPYAVGVVHIKKKKKKKKKIQWFGFFPISSFWVAADIPLY